MAPAAAVAYSIFISVPQAQQALPLSVGLALIACICAATAIGQLAKLFPSAGGMYTYAGKTLGPWAGFLVAWLFILFQPLVAPFLYLEFGWAMSDVFKNSIGWHYSGQWWIWVVLMTVIVFLLTYRDIRLSTTAGVILGAFEITIFYVLCSYAWVFGAGFDHFVKQATTNADPWRNLGKVFWGGGWVLVFLAICNSIAANSNAAVNAATRVFYSLARNRLAPRQLGHTHPEFKTPNVAIIWMSGFALVLSLIVGWKWNPGIGFGVIATAAVPLVIVVYMLVC